MKVIHSDPAATIKIGGVRCLHSSLCKSHHLETFILTLRGWLHRRQISGNQVVGDENMAVKTKNSFFCAPAESQERRQSEKARVNLAVLEFKETAQTF